MLLGSDERVWALSREARLSGMCSQMHARQTLMRCPDVLLRPLDLASAETEHSAFLAALTRTGLPVEAQTWGAAYTALHGDAGNHIQPLCTEIGQQVHQALGDPLTPALGWDTGKFTAHAAASYAKVGHMRLVQHDDESRFLNPLPFNLLPLPSLSLQQLHWLGIRTLGQFARLPATAVWQRFGAAGKLAQAWARGRDTRPVNVNVQPLPEPIHVEFDPPTALHPVALAHIVKALRAPLRLLTEQLSGCHRLRVALQFADEGSRTVDCVFIEPVGDGVRLRALLAHQLETLNWPAELIAVHITILETSELIAHQLTAATSAMPGVRRAGWRRRLPQMNGWRC